MINVQLSIDRGWLVRIDFVEKSPYFRFVKPLFLAGIDKGFNHELCRCFTQSLKFISVSKKRHVNL